LEDICRNGENQERKSGEVLAVQEVLSFISIINRKILGEQLMTLNIFLISIHRMKALTTSNLALVSILFFRENLLAQFFYQWYNSYEEHRDFRMNWRMVCNTK
jgi:hypothetical protein